MAEYVIDSLEIAQIVNMEHKNLLRKIHGCNRVTGIIDYLRKEEVDIKDYLLESSYQDIKNEARKLYKFTKLGWHFLCNTFTGYRGHLLTNEYLKRYGKFEQ